MFLLEKILLFEIFHKVDLQTLDLVLKQNMSVNVFWASSVRTTRSGEKTTDAETLFSHENSNKLHWSIRSYERWKNDEYDLN